MGRVPAIVHVEDRAVVWSRRGTDLTDRSYVPEPAGLAAVVPPDTVLDGELMVVDCAGRADFEPDRVTALDREVARSPDGSRARPAAAFWTGTASSRRCSSLPIDVWRRWAGPGRPRGRSLLGSQSEQCRLVGETADELNVAAVNHA